MQQTRVTELDGLRGLAALAVVAFHYFYRYNKLYEHTFEVPDLFYLGSYGVQLFFMISGFVIYWTISKSEYPLDFIWSRFSRLYPVFWCSVTLTFALISIFGLPGRESKLITYFINLSMLHEYLGISHIDGAYWSLTLELSFYFWILILFSINQIKHIEKWLILWVLIGTLYTFYKFELKANPLLTKFLLLQYIEFFSAGVCFYKIKNKNPSYWTYSLLFVSLLSVFMKYSTKTAFGLALFFCIFSLVILDKAKILSNRYILYLGNISYSLYLLHQNIGYIIIIKFKEFNYPTELGLATAFISSLLLASIFTYYIEKPSLNLLRNFYKRNTKIQRIRNKFILFPAVNS